MTQKEIEKFLANTKVYVNGKSKEIQEKLFDFGYKWCSGNPTKVSYVDDPFLFIYINREISCSNEMSLFKEHDNREITAEQILALELTESSYRPFEDAEECWLEMLMHGPFGWVIYDDYYVHIHEVGCGEISCLHGQETCFIELKDAVDCIKFADGTPFGIKKE